MRFTRRCRRQVNEWSIILVAVTLVLAAGPTLILPRPTWHVWTGVAFTAAVVVHLVMHRRSIAVLPGGWRARPGGHWVRTGDALREVLALGVMVTSVSLILGWPGETLHVIAGFVLVPLAIWHAVGHRRWIGRVLRHRLSS